MHAMSQWLTECPKFPDRPTYRYSRNFYICGKVTAGSEEAPPRAKLAPGNARYRASRALSRASRHARVLSPKFGAKIARDWSEVFADSRTETRASHARDNATGARVLSPMVSDQSDMDRPTCARGYPLPENQIFCTVMHVTFFQKTAGQNGRLARAIAHVLTPLKKRDWTKFFSSRRF